MRHFSLVIAALAGSVAAFPAAALELIELDDIIISAGQEPRAAGRTGATVTTATATAVKATGELSLTEFLARMPGIGILARGGLGGQTGFTLRGASQNYVKVLVDGIDVADPSGPQVAFDMGRLTSLNFGRAELLRGSQSAVHGGQAVAGVLSFESPTLATHRHPAGARARGGCLRHGSAQLRLCAAQRHWQYRVHSFAHHHRRLFGGGGRHRGRRIHRLARFAKGRDDAG